MEKKELPLGFGIALAQDTDAMKVFANISESGQAEILQRAHAVSSKNEMKALINELSAHK